MRARTLAAERQTASQRPARQKTGKKSAGQRVKRSNGKLPVAGPVMKLKRPPRLPKRVPADVGLPAVPAEKPVPVQPSEPFRPPVQYLDLSKEKPVTVKEAAYRLGKSVDAVRLWLRSGRLRGWQPGGRGCAILVAEASIDEALSCPIGGNGNGLHLPVRRSEPTSSTTS